MKFDKSSLLLYAVTDRGLAEGRDFYRMVEEALKGGITALQLREKDLDPSHFMEEARVIKELCRKYKVPFIINDNVEIALAVGADGIHVGQEDMAAAEIRARAGSDLFIGVSVHSPKEAEEAFRAGADYLGLGAVFPTPTKDDVTLMDHGLMKEITGRSPLPSVAIGGIHAGNILELSGTGLDGVAVVSAIFGKEDPREAARELLHLSERMVNSHG